MHVNKTAYTSLGLNIMTDDQVERIHNGTLQTLERVGVKIFEPEALDLLRLAGARVDGNLAKIPAWMVQDALQSAPKTVSLTNRDGSAAMNLEKGRSYYGAGSEVPFTIDLENGKRRKVLKSDVCNSSKLIDSLKKY